MDTLHAVLSAVAFVPIVGGIGAVVLMLRDGEGARSDAAESAHDAPTPGQGSTEAASGRATTPDAHRGVQGLWRRVRRYWADGTGR